MVSTVRANCQRIEFPLHTQVVTAMFSAKYSSIFLLLAAVFGIVAVASRDIVLLAILFLYVAFSFLLLSLAYVGVGPRLLLKRSDGRRSPLSWFLFWPYFLLNAFSFTLYCCVSREANHVLAARNLYLGRRLTEYEAGQLLALGVVGTLDLSAEFAEVKALRELLHYRSLPLLDATAPTLEQLQSAVAWLRDTTAIGPVFVHCALGHGRSAAVVMGYLLDGGLVNTVKEGLTHLRSLRPGVKLHWAQRRVLEQFLKSKQAVQGRAGDVTD